MTSLSTTHKYTVFVIAVAVTVLWAVSVTYVSNYISLQTGFDPLKLIGSGAVLGPKKIAALTYVIFGGVGLIVTGYVLTLTRPGRFWRLLILVLCVPLLLVANTWLDTVPLGPAQERIQVNRLQTVNYDAIFNDDAIRRGQLKTNAEFRSAVDANYLVHRKALSEAWNISDESMLRAIFYLNTVANLFSFGNSNLNVEGGCAAQNEQFGTNQRSIKNLGIRFYMDSQIGCCTDYALLLQLLLNGAGIDNRVVILPTHGHVFNEFNLNGTWHALDANIGAIYDRTWNDIVDGQGPFSVTVFPVLSLNSMNPNRYRPILAQFRHKTFMVAATGAEHSVPTTSSALKLN
ncbi:MAG: hypothetical protein JKY27_11530 [Magnetovibrio sp.]|nr:hypothetical protein [Magnetovibrio sp.]